RAMASEYVGVAYRGRMGSQESIPWRVVGAIKDTQLTWEPDVGGPAMLGAGEYVDIRTSTPFQVHSQDKDHPFMLFAYMEGLGYGTGSIGPGYGDPEFVRSVPPAQWMKRYVFFTDPTYPETNLVIVRKKGSSGFVDVTLDCRGTLTGWETLGTNYEYTRVDLVRHQFEGQSGCDNGRHEMSSDEPFGLWVWGWGSPETLGGCLPYDDPNYTCMVSYGYPA